MKLPIVRKLADEYSLSELHDLEEKIINDVPIDINDLGDDEGEVLTHVLAAIYIKNIMQQDGLELSVALRQYTSRVRDTLS